MVDNWDGPNGDYVGNWLSSGMHYSEYEKLKSKNRLKGPKQPFDKKLELKNQLGSTLCAIQHHIIQVSQHQYETLQDFGYYGPIRTTVAEVQASKLVRLSKGRQPSSSNRL